MPRAGRQVTLSALAILNAHETEAPRPVIVIAAGSAFACSESSIHEIKSLLSGLGYQVEHVLAQRNAKLGAPSVLGAGKLAELRYVFEAIEESTSVPPVLAFVAEITASQQGLLERDFETDVLDRTGIILRVFEQRARTRLSKLELEAARLNYGMPRLRDEKGVDDREGGGGRGARGDSNVELAKQNARERVAALRREIDIEQRQIHRRATRREEAPRVALVGYTNAGKSSWMRKLTGSDVFVKDQLFATLDTTVRALLPETAPRILVSDTVGFIQEIPHSLMASFRSTLDEALETDLLLQIADAADPRLDEQLKVTAEVLEQVGAIEIPRRLVLNKVDQISDERRQQLEEQHPEALFLSARKSEDIALVHALLVAFFEDPMQEFTFELPFDDFGKLSAARDEARVLSEKYTDSGVTVTLLSNRITLERLGLLEPPERVKEFWEL